MTYSTLEDAAIELLERFGLHSDKVPLRNIEDVNIALRGSGYSFEKIELIKGIFPALEGILAGILDGPEVSPVVFLIDERGLVKISSGNASEEVIDIETLQSFNQGWVLKSKLIEMSKISPFIKKYKKKFIDLFACALIINFFALFFPLFSSFVYDKILGNGITETLWAIAICLFMIMGIEFCVRIIRINAAERFAIGSETDIDYGIFKRLLELKANKIPSIAVFLEKYKQILSYRDLLSSSYLLSIADVPFVVLFLITIAAVGGPMVFIAVLFGCIMTVINALFIRPVLEYDIISKVGSQKRFGLMTDLLTSREAIIGSAFQADLQRKLQQASVETAFAGSRSRYWRGFGMSVSNSLSYFSYVAVLVAGVYMVESHQMTSGGLLAVSMLTSRAMSSTSSISNLIIRFREFQTALREIDQVLPAPVIRKILPPQGKLTGALRVENVSCVLKQGEKPILEKINFRINHGEIVGIAGVPGAGKTTLMRLLAGVLEPDEGRIYIDDIPLDQVSPDDITLSIGYKPQDLCLLDGSIENNVRAGRRQLNGEERKDVLTRSGLEFAFKQGGIGWETDIGARGSRVSGGQKQLISLARSMLFGPSVLLLDEPTNGLDAGLEAYLAKQISGLRGKSTVLVSTHSHHLLSICDRIIAVGQSKILADGPREKILMPQQQATA